MFYRGQIVECIDDTDCKVYLKHGQRYIVEVGDYMSSNLGPYIQLKGVALAFSPYRGFRARRFRPVVERKNEVGMEMLRKLLDPANHKHLEDA